MTDLEFVQDLANKLGEDCKGFEGHGKDPETGEDYTLFGIRCVRGTRAAMIRITSRERAFDEATLLTILREQLEHAYAKGT